VTLNRAKEGLVVVRQEVQLRVNGVWQRFLLKNLGTYASFMFVKYTDYNGRLHHQIFTVVQCLNVNSGADVDANPSCNYL